MGRAVKRATGNIRHRAAPLPKSSSERKYKSPLDRAAGWELVWPQVAPLFDAARPLQGVCYAYFIGEEDDGPIKIGSAKDPILRLRALQTGNSRRLRIEHVLLGDQTTEKLLHELWEPFAIRSHRGKKVDAPPGTEWFTGDVRKKLAPILKTAAKEQIKALAEGGDILVDDLERSLRLAHAEHGFEFHRRDEVRLLGAGGGYVIASRRSRV